MASPSEIAQVRINTDLVNQDEPWDDDAIGAMIDQGLSVTRTSAELWRRKAAGVSGLVSMSEAGASHSFSDLQDQYLTMAKMYDDMAATAEADITGGGTGRVKINVIDR